MSHTLRINETVAGRSSDISTGAVNGMSPPGGELSQLDKPNFPEHTREQARRLLAAGISCVAIRLGGSKRPRGPWSHLQNRLPTVEEIEQSFAVNAGLGIVCGRVSGYVECIDFDLNADVNFPKWFKRLPERLRNQLTIVATGGGGYHAYYRCSAVGRSQKLARSCDKKVLIETRSEGSLAITAGSHPDVHKTRKPYVHYCGPVLEDVQTINPEDRDLLLAEARELDELGAPFQAAKKTHVPDVHSQPTDSFEATDPSTPWGDLNTNGDWATVIEPTGWTSSDGREWRRPGKQGEGNSANIVCAEDGCEVLTVFSFNAGPLAPEDGDHVSHALSRAFAKLYYEDDRSAAASALRQCGYGDPDVSSAAKEAALGKLIAQRLEIMEAANEKAVPHVSSQLEPRSEWPPITPLEPPLPEFPLDALPQRFREFVTEVAKVTGTPEAMSAMMALAVVSLCLTKRVSIHAGVSGWIEPANLYFWISMPSGSRKSAVYRLCVGPLLDIQSQLRRRNRDVFAHEAARYKILEKQVHNAVLQAAKSDDLDGPAARRAEQLLVRFENMREPQELTCVLDDVTPESATKVAAANSGRLGLFSPEAAILAIILGRYSKGVPPLELFLHGYSGDRMDVSRITRAGVPSFSPWINMLVVGQPSLLAEALAKKVLVDRGFMQRFLYFGSQPKPFAECIYDKAPIEDVVFSSYRKLVEELAGDWVTLPNAPEVVQLSEAAQVLRQAHQQDLIRRTNDCESDRLKGWYHKCAGNTLRLTLLLHCIKHGLTIGSKREVDSQTFHEAVRIMEFFVAHAANTFGAREDFDDEQIADARLVVSKLQEKRHGATTITRRDMQRLSSSRFGKDDGLLRLERAFVALESHGYVRLDPSENNGGKRQYDVSPFVWADSPAQPTSSELYRATVDSPQPVVADIGPNRADSSATPASTSPKKRVKRVKRSTKAKQASLSPHATPPMASAGDKTPARPATSGAKASKNGDKANAAKPKKVVKKVSKRRPVPVDKTTATAKPKLVKKVVKAKASTAKPEATKLLKQPANSRIKIRHAS